MSAVPNIPVTALGRAKTRTRSCQWTNNYSGIVTRYASSSTFPASSTFSIGTASADRIVAAAVYNSYGQAPTSVTICGATGIAVTGTFVVNTEEYYAPVPSGTTCSIVVNGTNQKDEGVEVWSIQARAVARRRPRAGVARSSRHAIADQRDDHREQRRDVAISASCFSATATNLTFGDTSGPLL